MAILEFDNVSKYYGDVAAIAPMNLSFEAAKTYVLLGTSGCGKSTLLKLALRLLLPDSGVVRFNGEPLDDRNMLQVRRRIGYVIQEGGLFPHLTAAENVALVAKYLGWSNQQIKARVTDLAELVQIPYADLDRFPRQLSGGQQQRIGLMRSLMLDPDVLLLDEPLGALDPMIRSDLQSDLQQIFKTLNKTVILVTHDLNEAARLCDEVLLLRAGRILQRGRITDLMESPADPFVTRFINAQRMARMDECS